MKKSTLGLLLVFVCCAAANAFAALDPREIRDPRPAGWVVDRVGVLSTDDVASLNRLGDAVRARRQRAGLFVVTVPTTQGANHRWFATELLNRWGPNRSLRGALIVFIAPDDRKAEIVFGDDLNDVSARSASDRIMRDEIVARMKQRDLRGALLGGARASAAEIFGVATEADGRVLPPTAETARDVSAPAASPAADANQLIERPTDAPPVPTPTSEGTPRAPSTTAEKHPTLSLIVGLLMILVPLGGLAVVIVVIVRVVTGPRKCRRCAREMQKLDPAAEAPHLAPSEQTEEKLGSVNYDVWLCGGCGGVEKIRHGKWFTRYSRCPKCTAVTRSDVSRTVQAATRWSTGLAEVTEHCAHCGYHHVSMQVLARLPEPSRSSSSSGSRSSGRSSSGGGSSGSW